MTDGAYRREGLLPTEPNGVETVAKFFRALGDPGRWSSPTRQGSSNAAPGVCLNLW